VRKRVLVSLLRNTRGVSKIVFYSRGASELIFRYRSHVFMFLECPRFRENFIPSFCLSTQVS
jgi:hypothetical protein